MSKPELIQRSGWAFVAGAFAFITLLSDSDPIAIPGSLVSAVLLTVGMSGLRAAYGERAGSLGRSMLLLGMLGPLLWVIVMLSMALLSSSGNLTDTDWRRFMGADLHRPRNLITWLVLVWPDCVAQ